MKMRRVPIWLLCLAATTVVTRLSAQQPTLASAIDAYMEPYVASSNFAGQVLVRRRGKVIYERNFGEADRERRIPNTANTRFHVASVSMMLTSAAALRLVDHGKLSLDTRVSEIIPSLRGGERITIRNLLEQRSGVSDINSRPDYADIIQHRQTPASLVAFVSNDSLLFAPGSKYAHEEHSAFNILALIIERKTGLDFPHAMQRLLFAPARMAHSAVDDDAGACRDAARGYAPVGVSGIGAAQQIYWTAKAGNASACTTASDEARYVDEIFHGKLFGSATRALVVDTAGPPVGYGWFRRQSSRFGEFAYNMSGRAPGFASFVLYLPREDLTVVALSNIYSSSTGNIGNDIAAIALGLPYQPLTIRAPLLAADSLAIAAKRFTFSADFYQPNATLEFHQQGAEMFLRWPSGDLSPLIPLDRDHFIDRAYWEPVTIARGDGGVPLSITYGRFTGSPDRR
jgi:CubicO group peptidase (beta-lactamase class C family)